MAAFAVSFGHQAHTKRYQGRSDFRHPRTFLHGRGAESRMKSQAVLSVVPWVILFSILSMGALYMYFVSSATGEGYHLRERGILLEDLKRKKEGLILKKSFLTSVGQLESRAQKLEFVEAGTVRYVPVPGTVVASVPRTGPESGSRE